MTTNSQSVQAALARRRLLLATLVTAVLLFVPYSQYLLYPVRLFVTLIHESGHALAATLTGSVVRGIALSPNTSGVTLTQGPYWAQWVIDPAGYLGAALFGAVMLQTGRLGGRNAGRMVLGAMAAAVLAATLVWCHNPLVSGLFTPAAGLTVFVLLGLAAFYTRAETALFLAVFLAVQCCLDALNDLGTLLLITANNLGDNDASNMAHVSHIPATFWAVSWALLAMLILGVSLRGYWRATSHSVRREES